MPNSNQYTYKALWRLSPLLGSILFVVLYFTATLLYPGGSQADAHSAGFSWVDNYWCNLLAEKAINGSINEARPIALTAMIELTVTLISFWIIYSLESNLDQKLKKLILYSGIISIVTATFIITSYHDLVINIAGAFGLVAIACVMYGLYNSKWLFLFVLGTINLLLIGANNYLYYSDGLMKYLPLVQKLSFFIFLLWISLISLKIYNRKRMVHQNLF